MSSNIEQQQERVTEEELAVEYKLLVDDYRGIRKYPNDLNILLERVAHDFESHSRNFKECNRSNNYWDLVLSIAQVISLTGIEEPLFDRILDLVEHLSLDKTGTTMSIRSLARATLMVM